MAYHINTAIEHKIQISAGSTSNFNRHKFRYIIHLRKLFVTKQCDIYCGICNNLFACARHRQEITSKVNKICKSQRTRL